jgi:arylsulfatase A-like enzyme
MLSRRRFFFLGSLALPAMAAKKPASERPNVVLIVVDNLPAGVLGIYGGKQFRTPNLDRLAQTGTRFTNHIVAAPAPGPGRATLLTGRTPMQLGDAGTVSANDIALDKVLGGLGYGCHATAAGSSVEVSAEAVKLLDQQAAGKPFLLTAAYADLKPPYDGVAQKYSDLYARTTFESLGYEPAAATARGGRAMLANTAASLRSFGAALTALDDSLAGVIARLYQRKLVDSTLVVLAGSCGALLGRHGLWDAGDASEPVNMYREALTTPLIWSWPGRVPAQGVRPELVSTYDFLPAICELTGTALPARNLCGRSYLPLATGKPLPKKQPWRKTVFAHFRNTDMAGEDRYKLVERDGGKGPGELYDESVDPGEKTNQYGNPQFLTVRTALGTELGKWKQRYSG